MKLVSVLFYKNHQKPRLLVMKYVVHFCMFECTYFEFNIATIITFIKIVSYAYSLSLYYWHLRLLKKSTYTS